VIFPSHEIGGAERYAQTVAAAAAQRGFRVTVCFPDVAATRALRAELADQGVDTLPLQIGFQHGFGARAALQEELRDLGRTWRLLARLRPARVVLVLPHPDQSLGSTMATALWPGHCTVVVQLVPEVMRITRLRRWAYRVARALGQRWVAVSDDNAARLAGELRWGRESIDRIYNGVDVTRFQCADRALVRAQVRQRLGLPADAQIFLTVARLSPQKAHEVLLDAIPAVAAAYPRAVWIWAGDGEDREMLAERIEQAGLSARVLMLGTRSDVTQLLIAADAFVLPSRAEGLPFALLEAMAAGTTVLATALAPIRELIDSGVHGRLVPVADAPALQAGMAAVLDDPAVTQRLIEAGERRVRERHSAAAMVDDVLAPPVRRRGLRTGRRLQPGS
jgi:glycosyltransferase involved in cell wall biosynthesis